MAYIYTEKADSLGWRYVERLDNDAPESVTVIPVNEENADYRAYQDWLAERNTPEPWPPAE